jgi:hypothetical protein
MRTDSQPGKRAKATQSASQDTVRVQKAVAFVPAAELRAALLEANDTISMVDKAIKTAKQEQEEDTLRYKPLFDACVAGDEPKARALLATGLDVNWHNKQGATPLHVAACDGHTNVVRMLLEQGAEVDLPLGEVQSQLGISFVGATPWFLAKANQKGPVAELLYSYGANPNVTTGSGLSWQEAAEVFSKAGVVSMSLCQK